MVRMVYFNLEADTMNQIGEKELSRTAKQQNALKNLTTSL